MDQNRKKKEIGAQGYWIEIERKFWFNTPSFSPSKKKSSKLQFFVVEKLYWARAWVGVLAYTDGPENEWKRLFFDNVRNTMYPWLVFSWILDNILPFRSLESKTDWHWSNLWEERSLLQHGNLASSEATKYICTLYAFLPSEKLQNFNSYSIFEGLQINFKADNVKKEFHGWVNKSLTQRWREYFVRGGGGGAWGYNYALIPDRGTEQQIARNEQVGFFTEGGNTVIFHECENTSESRFQLSFHSFLFYMYMCMYILKYFRTPIAKKFFFRNFPFCSLRKKVTPKSLLFLSPHVTSFHPTPNWPEGEKTCNWLCIIRSAKCIFSKRLSTSVSSMLSFRILEHVWLKIIQLKSIHNPEW